MLVPPTNTRYVSPEPLERSDQPIGPVVAGLEVERGRGRNGPAAGWGEMAMKPPAVCWVTVRLPEDGLGSRWGCPSGRRPAGCGRRWRGNRVVQRRRGRCLAGVHDWLGFIGTKRSPAVPGLNQPVTSSTTCVLAPVVPLNTIESEPEPSSGANTPLARLSLIGKLSVDGRVGRQVLVTARKPPDVCCVTVRLPVMAVALTPGCRRGPAMTSVRGVLLTNWPARPVPIRAIEDTSRGVGWWTSPRCRPRGSSPSRRRPGASACQRPPCRPPIGCRSTTAARSGCWPGSRQSGS